VDAVSVVAMSTGAAFIGSAFGPTNPFQAGIAMKLAQLPAGSAAVLRWSTFAAAVTLWIAWTAWYARSSSHEPVESTAAGVTRNDIGPATGQDYLILAIAVAPIAAYVYGSVALGWGFNELSGGFLVAGAIAGLLGGLGATGTVLAYLDGMKESVWRGHCRSCSPMAASSTRS
jgi:uncharacterized ion transporter superfamily protein YfcC